MKTSSQLIRDRVWRGRGPLRWLGWLLLFPASVLFGLGVALRDLAFRFGLLRTQRANIPVISVGNLAVGGTGKTPITLWLAGQLQQAGLKVAIISRGYGGSAADSAVTIVSEGSGPIVSPLLAGDEAVMMARRFSGPVIAAPRRIDGVAAAEKLGCDAVLLDDGFQHRVLARDFDLVLVNGVTGGLLPGGPLREPWSALRRADAVAVVSKYDSDDGSAAALVPAGKPIFMVRFAARTLLESDSGVWRELPAGTLSGRQVAVVSGIAEPEAFYDTIRQWEGQIEEIFEYPDHYQYTETDWQQLLLKTRSIDLIVTTEKDLVKLERFPFARGKLLAVRILPEIDRGEELVRLLLERTGYKDKVGVDDSPE